MEAAHRGVVKERYDDAAPPPSTQQHFAALFFFFREGDILVADILTVSIWHVVG